MRDDLTPEERERLYQTLRQKYEAAADDSDVQAADRNARRADMLGGILGGVSQIMSAESVSRGNRAPDTSWTKDVGNTARRTAAAAREQRKNRIDSVLEGDRLDQAEKTRKLADEDRTYQLGQRTRQDRMNADVDAQTTREKDPSSQESAVARDLAKKLMPTGNFDGMSAAQLKGSLPILEKMYAAEQQRILRLEGAEERREARDNALKTAENNRIESDVQKLREDLQGSQGVNNSISSIENQIGFPLEDYEGKGKVKGRKGEVDLPGVSVPGLGRISAYDSDARTLQDRMSTVFNTVLKDRSGNAVTSNELERLRSEFSAGKFNTEDEMLGALRDYKKAAGLAMKNIEAGYRPEVVERYGSRGGATSAAAPAKPTTAGKVRMLDENGKPFWVPEKNVEVARKKGWKIAE